MIDAYELHQRMDELHKQVEDFDATLDVDHLREEYENYSIETEKPDFWNDQERAQRFLKGATRLHVKSVYAD